MLHVLAIVLWITGVAMVTTVLLPAVQRIESGTRRIELFEAIEGRFAWQARFATLRPEDWRALIQALPSCVDPLRAAPIERRFIALVAAVAPSPD